MNRRRLPGGWAGVLVVWSFFSSCRLEEAIPEVAPAPPIVLPPTTGSRPPSPPIFGGGGEGAEVPSGQEGPTAGASPDASVSPPDRASDGASVPDVDPAGVPDAGPPAVPPAAPPSQPPPPPTSPLPPSPPPPTSPPPPSGRRALMVVGEEPLIATDVAVRARLAAELSVEVVVQDVATTEDADGKALVMLTSSVTVAGTGTKFRDVPVPLILLEPNLLGLMRLTAEPPSDHGATQRTETQIRIVDEDHPLAAGFGGDVTVYPSPWRLTWGVPGPEAIKVATVVGAPDQWVIFAYPRGAGLFGTTAPAKRVVFFLHDNTAKNLTDDALELLDAAIDFALD